MASRALDLDTVVADALRDIRREPAADNATRVESSGVVLAVSGGRDSMVLLHAAAARARSTVRAVATFDHATGTHATTAADLVAETADALGIPVWRGRAEHAGRTEAEWRDARWRFLRACAREVGAAAVATAHTRDDQYETVVMRALRGSGARGLAGLAAPSAGVIRPLLGVGRADVAAYARTRGVRWLDDPANDDRRHLRVRVRADLRPATARVAPGVDERAIALAASAAAHRAAVDAWVVRLCAVDGSQRGMVVERATVNESLHGVPTPCARVLVAALAECDADALALFWPAFAARAGVRLDRRAIARLVAYTPHAIARVRDGTVQPGRIPVAGVTDAGIWAARADASVQHVVVLEHAPIDAPVSGRVDAPANGRAWQFAVRTVAVHRDPARSPARTRVGMTAPASPDYA